MIAVQKRSGKRHLVHPDGLATRCGRVLHRVHFRIVERSNDADCSLCWTSMGSALQKQWTKR